MFCRCIKNHFKSCCFIIYLEHVLSLSLLSYIDAHCAWMRCCHVKNAVCVHGYNLYHNLSLFIIYFSHVYPWISHFPSLQYRIGSETESMNSISGTDDTFQWGGPQDDSLRFGNESHGLMDSCLWVFWPIVLCITKT